MSLQCTQIMLAPDYNLLNSWSAMADVLRNEAMSFADQIHEVAVRLATYGESRAAALKQELLKVEARKRELEAALDVAKFANERLRDFVPTHGSEFQCPHCWIEHETLSALRPVSRGTGNDIFECDTCQYEYVVR